MDSIDVMELVMHTEELLSINFPDEIQPKTIGDILNEVNKLRQSCIPTTNR